MCFLRINKMRVLVFGSKEWKDYNDLIRQVTILIEDNRHHYPDDQECIFIHKGLHGAENMITEYIGKTEKFLRQKGYKIKEEIIRDKSSYSDLTMIESEPNIALIFGDSARNKTCKNLLEEYNIPYRYFKD